MRPEAALTGHTDRQPRGCQTQFRLAAAGVDGTGWALDLAAEGAEGIGVGITHLQCGAEAEAEQPP